nr:ATP-binding domain-containing protein [candidate division KSB1 bacterium]NIR72292.1 ATP-binding domain-containing protein [candidate division KSB1 bacterium]NIS24262.1 ATP-binding domain-containing protein [candidate division KSB1 bacterium]NIT71177.1 ATP-binding domain-containing protein [candidate division KSB1 bacterium]NIU24881.1 ATP-binding domain-containing protein [candidate division KSB1 bacterium]
LRATIDLARHGQHLSTYTAEPRTFHQGEKIIFLKNDHQLKVENGTTGKITRINPVDGRIRVLTDNRQPVDFHPRSYPYVDYGYATTNYKVQGMTADEVLYVADTRTNPSYNSLYVAATRGKHGLNIYTNDKAVLQQQVHLEEAKSSNLDYDLSPELELERSLDRERMDNR